MPFIETTKSASKDEIIDANLQRLSTGNGYIQLPSNSQILERLYNDQGVRVRMIRRNRPKKIPTVRELIDQLAKKHERLLEMEGKGAKIESRSPVERNRVNLDSPSMSDLTELKDTDSGRDSKKDGVSSINGPKQAVFTGRGKKNGSLVESKVRLDPLPGTERRASFNDRIGNKDKVEGSRRMW